MSHKSKRPVMTSASANDALGDTLAALDAVIADAQQQEQQLSDANPTSAGKKRHRGGEVFAAMAEPHFHTLRTLLVTYGVQLMPSLDAMMRRVLLMISSPALASSACWELAALLGTYFKAGAARLLEELMELLLNDPSPFLLGAPFVTAAGTEGEDGGGAGNEEEAAVVRNLRAFEELLLAVGPCMGSATMQRAALRFAQEVVTAGMLDVPPPCVAGGMDGGNSEALQQTENATDAAVFVVEAALQPLCVDILTAFLLLCRPLPSVVAACAVRAAKEFPAERLTTPRGRRDRQQLLRAVARLSVTLTALRHPHAVPFYLPPVDVVEKATRRVAGSLAADTSAAVDESPVVEQRQQQQQQQQQQLKEKREHPASPIFTHSLPPLPQQRQQQQQPTSDGAVSKQKPQSPAHTKANDTHDRVAVPPQQQQRKLRLEPVKPQPLAGSDDDDEDDLPDIDMED